MNLDRATALAVLSDCAHNMRKSTDLFGNKILTIRVDEFEAIRARYLDVGEKKEGDSV